MSAQNRPVKPDGISNQPGRASEAESSNRYLGLPLSEQRRYDSFRVLLTAAIPAGIITLVFYLFIYTQTRAWQMLFVAVGIVVALGCFVFSYRTYRQFNLSLAATFLLMAVFVAYLSGEMVWLHATLYQAMGGALLMILLGTLVFPRKWYIWAGTTLAFLAVIYFINRYEPLPRFDVTLVPLLNIYLPIITAILVLVTTWQMGRAFFVGSIRTRLLLAFTLIVLVPAGIIAILSSTVGAQTIRNRLIYQLDTVATIKQSDIVSWAASLNNNLTTVFTEPDYQRLESILSDNPTDAAAVVKYDKDKLRSQMNQSLSLGQTFEEIFLMNSNGKIMLSTDTAQEGKTLRGATVAQGINHPYVAPPFYSPTLKKYTVTASQPLLDPQGKILGIIAGRANLNRINAIMQASAGLGETGTSYLVDTNKVMITADNPRDLNRAARTEAVNQVLATKGSYSGEYSSAWGIPVVGVSHWIPELQTVLVAEQNQQEAFAPVNSILTLNLAVSLASIFLAIVAALLITRSIANPIATLSNTASEIAAGNLDLTVQVHREDEVGTLANSFNAMSTQLRALIGSLEQRVAERTRDVEKRSAQLRLAADVARDITLTTDLDELMNKAVNLIRERFGFYHAGLFLVDDQGVYAVLRAATGEAGRQMLAQGHKLKVGEVGLVGFVTGSGQPRIALDVGKDAVHFRNPFLPKTRSEVALPLRVGKRIIGALDVQSTVSSAFTTEDITILQIMADQLAVAIENARLILKLNQTVDQLEQAYGTYTQEGWRSFTRSSSRALSYRYRQSNIEHVEQLYPEAQQALESGQTVIQPIMVEAGSAAGPAGGANNGLAVPIKLRDQVIGVLNMRFSGEQISPDTIKLVEEAASRLALVLENARLLQNAQRLAAREQQINLIANQVRSSVNLETILQNTVRELGRAVGASRAFIQIGSLASSVEAPGAEPGLAKTSTSEEGLPPAEPNVADVAHTTELTAQNR